ANTSKNSKRSKNANVPSNATTFIKPSERPKNRLVATPARSLSTSPYTAKAKNKPPPSPTA
ncbi:MAG: hypothetical protein AAGH40_14915, partial [Verrucomicrobiota bacterium]